MKHAFVKILGVVIAAALFSACNNEAVKTETASFSLDSVKAQIAASNKVFGASFATGDSVAFANCYTSDGCIYNANMPKVCGTAGIRSFLSIGYNSGLRNVVLTTEEVMGGKEAVVETGKYEVFIADNVSVEKENLWWYGKKRTAGGKCSVISGIQMHLRHRRRRQNNE
ncbi:MAG: hypothetical protein IPG38_00240 [Chitinophagaceae bacterium]|nr:hypothetical protein [Chitinophagaceae bacterium]